MLILIISINTHDPINIILKTLFRPSSQSTDSIFSTGFWGDTNMYDPYRLIVDTIMVASACLHTVYYSITITKINIDSCTVQRSSMVPHWRSQSLGLGVRVGVRVKVRMKNRFFSVLPCLCLGLGLILAFVLVLSCLGLGWSCQVLSWFCLILILILISSCLVSSWLGLCIYPLVLSKSCLSTKKTLIRPYLVLVLV